MMQRWQQKATYGLLLLLTSISKLGGDGADKVRQPSVSVSESRVIAAMILSLFAQPRVLATDMTDQWLIKASSKSRNNFQYSELSRHQHQPVVSAL